MNSELKPNIFKVLRVSNDLSQKQLAENLGINPSHVNAIEKGKNYPSLSLLKRYCHYFNISFRTFLLLEDDSTEHGWSYQDLLFEILKVYKEKKDNL